MSGQIDIKILELLTKGIELSKIQNVFNTLISELVNYLKLNPLNQEIKIELLKADNFDKVTFLSILDYGVKRVFQKDIVIIYFSEDYNEFLPFILLREAYYSFVPKEASNIVKICINQIVENNLQHLSNSKGWKKLVRDTLVNNNFLDAQFNRLYKFFKIEAKEPFENTVQFFFRELRDKELLIHDDKINKFYDIISENYEYKTSKSLFNKDIVETLWILIRIFNISKLYLHLSDYSALFKKFKESSQIDTFLSLRKFNENLQWINNCTSIAPSYDLSRSIIDLYPIVGIIKFNPLLEKLKIKKLIEKWSFYKALKFSENSFATEISLNFFVPRMYLKDLLKYFDRLEASGYVVRKQFYQLLNKTSNINLNYFMDINHINRIIDPNNLKYEKKYEIETRIEYPTISSPPPLSFFDFMILSRIRYVSITGLTFDKRVETLNLIKDDVENELRKQVIINREFNDKIHNLLKSPDLYYQFFQFLDRNQSSGFIYLHSQLDKILTYLSLLPKVLNEHPEITNIYQFQTLLNTQEFFQNIEDNLLIRDETIKNNIFHNYFPLYFQSKASFREEIKKIKSYYDVLNVCYDLKIINLKTVRRIIEDPTVAKTILQKREKRYEEIFKPVGSYKITNNKIESTIKKFLNHTPPIIQPFLISTIYTSTFAKFYPVVVLKDTPKDLVKLNKLKKLFPKVFTWEIVNLSSKENLIYVLIYLINIEEKELFYSVLNSYFKDSIVFVKRFFFRGVERKPLIPKDFYDFENKQFFNINEFPKEFFQQLFLFSQKTFNDKLKWPKYSLKNNLQDNFWSKNKSIEDLVKKVKTRISYREIEFNLRDLGDLVEFRKNLEINLSVSSDFSNFKKSKFFTRYINSINFLPAFQKFGFSQYYLYFRPFYYTSPDFEIDFKLLFANSFQKIKFPACIEPDQAIFVEYIFPFRTPNKSYLNWLVKTKKIVTEYSLFTKKKYYNVIHFDRNLTKEGWDYSAIRFKSYMQNILFNPSYNPKISEIREFDLNKKSEPNIYGHNTQEYNTLTHIYNTRSIDIKSYLGSKNYSLINKITELLKKKLIFPYLSLKNLDLQEKISIILPNTKKDLNEKILKIFSFFNVCRMYEIEGEFYIYGFQKENSFENGLLIEIWFPKCELDEYFNVFDLLFQYLEIKHYIILTDLVNGKNLLKNVYGNLNFLKDYNPLLNLKWNAKDKIWMNHKLFNERFESIYPDLVIKNNQ